MYEIIRQIINHSWSTTNNGDQQYIYFICGVVIIVTFAVAIDLIYRFIYGVFRGGGT